MRKKKKYCSPDLELKRFTLCSDTLFANSIERDPGNTGIGDIGDDPIGDNPIGDDILNDIIP